MTTVSAIGLPCLLALFGFRKRHSYLAVVLLVLASLGGTLALNGCGTSNRFVQQDGTPPGTYSITVVGTSSGSVGPARILFDVTPVPATVSAIPRATASCAVLVIP